MIQLLPSGFNSFQAIGSNLFNPLDPTSHFFSSNSFNPSPLTLSSNLNQNIFSFPFHLFSPFPEHILFFLLRSITPIGNLLQIFNSHDLFLSVIFCQDNKFICAFSPVFPFFELNPCYNAQFLQFYNQSSGTTLVDFKLEDHFHHRSSTLWYGLQRELVKPIMLPWACKFPFTL